MRGVGSKREGLLEIKKVGLVGKKWLSGLELKKQEQKKI